MTSSKIISRIAILREQADLTQAQLAALLDVTSATIANWEKGRVSLENFAHVDKLCKIFYCVPDDLIMYVSIVQDVESSNPKVYKQRQLAELRQRLGTNNLEVKAIGAQDSLRRKEDI